MNLKAGIYFSHFKFEGSEGITLGYEDLFITVIKASRDDYPVPFDPFKDEPEDEGF